MKKSQLFVILALLALLMATNLLTKDPSKGFFGGLPWWGWAGIGLFPLVAGFAFALADLRRARPLLAEPLPPAPFLPAPRRHHGALHRLPRVRGRVPARRARNRQRHRDPGRARPVHGGH